MIFSLDNLKTIGFISYFLVSFFIVRLNLCLKIFEFHIIMDKKIISVLEKHLIETDREIQKELDNIKKIMKNSREKN